MTIKMFKKTPLINSIFAGILVGICLLGIAVPHTINADFANVTSEVKKAAKTIKVVVTAYSSTPDQTDDTPFITASGKPVASHIVANNGLPFGTKIRIPALYGSKIFIIGDRMNKRMGSHRFDLWFPSRELAIKFGVKKTEIEILQD